MKPKVIKSKIIEDRKTVPIVFSNRFESFIKRLLATYWTDSDKERDVAAFLYKSIGCGAEISFFDLTDKEDIVSYITANKVYKIYGECEILRKDFLKFVNTEKNNSSVYNHIEDYRGVWNINRTEIKVGKLFKKIDNSFINSDKKIEIFVNKFKALYKSINEPDFSLVSGKAINKWYNQKKYHFTAKIGSLGNSCMRHGYNLFEMYTENSEVCKLLILKSTEGRLLGRALIWKLTDDSMYMDRVYTHYDSDIFLFTMYALKKKWKTYYDYLKGDETESEMTVKLNDINYGRYPYLDTFRYYNVKKCILSSNYPKTRDKVYKCQTTDGSYTVV